VIPKNAYVKNYLFIKLLVMKKKFFPSVFSKIGHAFFKKLLKDILQVPAIDGRKVAFYSNARWPVQKVAALLLLLVIPCLSLLAQTRNVTGSVKDEKGMPVVGVSVVVKGGTEGTKTNDVGEFSITVSNKSILVFSAVGFNNKELAVKSQNYMVVDLVSATGSLNEVIVVSYGTKKQRDITGSVSTVSAASVQDIGASEFGQKLQGKVAGVQITQATGRPGQGMSFRIRGAASLSSGFQPLIVVDGQPLSGVSSRNGDVNLINPDEIETFTVLKDASATALYGSRAANGVILITTKQGKSGRTNVALNVYTGWQAVPKQGRPEMMNALEFATFMKGFYEDKALYEGYTGGIPADYANPAQYGEGTNWYNNILRTAPMQNYSLSLSTGTDKISSSNVLTYFNQEGVLLNTGMKRYSLRSNNEYRPNTKLKIGLNIAPSYQLDHNTRNGTDGSRQVIGIATAASPLISNRDAKGVYISRASSFGMLGMSNPVQQLELLDGNQTTIRLLSNLYAEVEVLKNLRFKSSFNIDLGNAEFNQFFGTMYGPSLNPPLLPRPSSQNSSTHSSYNYLSWLNENTLTYNFKIKEHAVDLLAGYSGQKWERNFRTISGSNFAGDAIPWVSGAAVNNGTNNNEAWSLASAFGRINYDYKGKYFLTGTIRQDGSSRFGDNEKYGYFPSVSAGWVLSDEAFFPKSDLVSFFKIRGSYGKTGNFNIGNYLQISNIANTNYVFGGALTPGLSVTSLGNKDLTWEVSKQTDIGLEMILLKKRLTFSYDYYSKLTEGMLYATSLPVASGYASVTANVGQFRMWGHEFQLSSKNLTGALSWSTDFNISFNDNKVLSLPPNTPFIGGGARYAGYNRSVVGSRIGEFYGYIFDGIYMTAAELASQPKEATSVVGSTRMKDVNGDGVITADDRTLIGNPNPDFIYGMTNTLKYKKFDFNVIIAGQAGNKVLNANFADYHNNDGVFNMSKDMINRWRSPTDQGDGKTPRTRSGTTELYRLANTTWISDGDFLTVKNIVLGYTFNASKLKYVKSARVYASIQQAFVFTKYTGQNPEASIGRDDAIGTYGQDLSTFPVPRTIMIGANINF
jgi:TonB-dependent starch-binding outer membrane protein SusC